MSVRPRVGRGLAARPRSATARREIRGHSVMKRLAKSVAARLGYEIRRSTGDEMAARSVRDSEYYTRWTPRCPLFTPWTGHPEFEAVYDGVAPHTVVSR